MDAIWRNYLSELRESPLLGPGLNPKLSAGQRRVVHFLFTTLRYVSTYLFFKPLSWLIMHSVSDFHVRGFENVPDTGPLVGTWNHLSEFDPIVGVLCSPLPPFVMTKAEYFKTPVLGGVVTIVGSFPVRRGEADRQAIKTALSVIKRGWLLGIYPEGTRSKTFQLQEAQPGAAMIATAGDPLVVPVALWGTENIMRRKKWGFLKHPRVEVVCGQPYKLKEEAARFATEHGLPPSGKKGRHDNLEFLSDILMLKIAELLPDDYRGEFWPEKIAARYLPTTIEAQQGSTKG